MTLIIHKICDSQEVNQGWLSGKKRVKREGGGWGAGKRLNPRVRNKTRAAHE